jgi:hypothetical protein
VCHFWTADAGDHEPFAVAIGTPYEHVKWFGGLRSTSNAPTRTAAPCSVAAGEPLVGHHLAERSSPLRTARQPSRRVPWSRPNRVLKFIERHQAENR